jgi:hypothetical protein
LTYGDEDHAVESQKTFPVFYQSELIGNLTPDLMTTRATLRPAGPPGVKNLQPIRDIRVIRASKTANCGSKKNSKKSLSDPGLFR